jgi:hypothetical protein
MDKHRGGCQSRQHGKGSPSGFVSGHQDKGSIRSSMSRAFYKTVSIRTQGEIATLFQLNSGTGKTGYQVPPSRCSRVQTLMQTHCGAFHE